MIGVASANFDDSSFGEHVLAQSEPYAILFCLSVCVYVCLSLSVHKNKLCYHITPTYVCVAYMYKTCNIIIISDLWKFCLSMLIRSCPSDQTNFGKKLCYHITSTYVCAHVKNLQHAFSMILSRTCEIFVSLC